MGKFKLYLMLGLFLLITFTLNILILPALKQCVLEEHFLSSVPLTSPALYGNCAGTAFAQLWPIVGIAAAAIIGLIIINPAKVITESSKKTAVALAILIAVTAGFLLAYFAPGRMLIYDGVVFQAASNSYYQTFSEGKLPFFFFPWALGSMHEVYHGQAFFALTGLANLLIRNIDVTYRAIAFLLHITSGVAAFYLIRHMLKNSQAALLGATIYALAPEHVIKILMLGRVIAAPIYALLPVAILLIELFMEARLSRKRFIIILGIISAFMFLSSPQDAEVIIALTLGYFALRMMSKRFTLRQAMRTALLGAAILVVFALLTSYWTVPYLTESKYVNNLQEKAIDEFAPKIPSAATALTPFFPITQATSLLKLSLDPSMKYLGLTAILLALLAFRKGSERRMKLLGACLAAVLALGIVISPRTEPFAALLLSILAAAGTIKLCSRISLHKPSASTWAYGVIFLVVAADLGMWSFLQVMPDFSKQEEVYGKNIPLMGENMRVLDLHSNRRTYYPALVYLDREVQVPFSILTVGEPKAFYYAATVANLAAQEIYDFNQSMSAELRQGLYMYNIGYVITHPDQTGMGAAASFSDKRQPLGLERTPPEVITTPASPIIIAGEIKKVPRISDAAEKGLFYSKSDFEDRNFPWQEVSAALLRMGMNTTKNSAATLPLADDEDNANAPSEEKVPALPEVSVMLHQVKTAEVKMTVNATAEGYAQLSYAYYPWMKVTVDGSEAQAYKSSFNLIVIRLPAGIHQITLTPTLTPLRKITGLISALTLILAASLLRPWRKASKNF